MNTPKPPKFAERFFHWFCHQNHLEGLEGDLFELFKQRVDQYGIKRARFHYILDVLTLIRPSVARSFINQTKTNILHMSILRNYLKTSFRTGKRQAGFSVINLLGLTLGISSVLFISIYIKDELSYDTHIKDVSQKFRIYDVREGDDGSVNYYPIVPPVFSTMLEEHFPQVETSGRIIFDYGGTIFNIGDHSFSEKNGVFAEKSALEILDLDMKEGDLSRMEEPQSIILSENTYQKFFGDESFNYQGISLGDREFQVVGVYKEFPEQFHLELDYIFPFENAVRNVTEERMNSWVWQQFYTYVKLQPGVNVDEFESDFQKFVSEHAKPITEEYGFFYTPHLQALGDIHLHSSNFEWDIAKRGNYQSILFLMVAAIIILVIACLNFVNLTTAQALKRAKEVCIRKFVGARRSQLLIQYGLEATLYTIVAGVLSCTLLVLVLPEFNSFTGKSISLSSIFTPMNVGLYIAFITGLGILAGTYPALLITSFKPLMALKGLTGNRKRGIEAKINTRQILVSTQYILSISLILMSLVILKQYEFLQNKDMGFTKENLVVIPLTDNLERDYDLTRETFSGKEGILDVAFSYGIPGGIVAGDGVYIPEKSDREFSCNMFMVDENYIQTMGMSIVEGRNFMSDLATDREEAFILNETAVRNFGLESPEKAIGVPVHWTIWGTDSTKIGRVIGVVKDFNFKSLHNEMTSTVLHMGSEYFQNLIVRVQESEIRETVSQLEASYRTFEPNRPFEYEFIDQTFTTFYESEQKLSVLFSIFTLLAIITAGIGLFGLVSFDIANRSKEISIRKVLGAGVSSVIQLLVSRYFLMVMICLILATPLAYIFAEKWLHNFSYQMQMDGWIFVEVVIITLLFTTITVGFQAFRGAVSNPAHKLRSE